MEKWHGSTHTYIQSSTRGSGDREPGFSVYGTTGLFDMGYLSSRTYMTSGKERTFLNAWTGQYHIYSGGYTVEPENVWFAGRGTAVCIGT